LVGVLGLDDLAEELESVGVGVHGAGWGKRGARVGDAAADFIRGKRNGRRRWSSRLSLLRLCLTDFFV
jgi:hypothetical protein